jgi:hypothetical protein
MVKQIELEPQQSLTQSLTSLSDEMFVITPQRSQQQSIPLENTLLGEKRFSIEWRRRTLLLLRLLAVLCCD